MPLLTSDAACRRLAVHILQRRGDVPARDIHSLAAVIQQAVENWLAANPERPPTEA